MENYVVRIKSYIGDKFIQNGTGICIDNNLILTAKHVVCGSKNKVIINGKEIDAVIVEENDVAAVLRLDKMVEIVKIADIFTTDEMFDENSIWNVNGYITTELLNHSMRGNGIMLADSEEEYWDYYLATTAIGKSRDYSGLSGSPVFCNNRIVGILQMQTTNSNGELGVRMSSVRMFRELLESKNIKENHCKIILKKACCEFTIAQVDKNVKSYKYIPDIFVEEKDYKESLRYFVDPMLFLKKSIKEVKGINFTTYNYLLNKNQDKTIDFSQFDENINPKQFDEIYDAFLSEINYVTEQIVGLEKNTPSGKYDLCEYYEKRQKYFNNSMKYFLSAIKDNLKYMNKRFLLLTKDAGQGKTNFLCDFTSNFLIKKKYFVLYYNANDFREDPKNIIKEQLRNMATEYSLEYVMKMLKSEWKKTRRPFVIVIDGLNENTSINEFGMCMRDFLEKSKKYPFVKVIMTTRNEFLEERFSPIKEGLYSELFEHVNMWDRNDTFKERIFYGYLSFFDITFRKNTLTNRSYDKLTSDILLLRFFCEVNTGKRQIYLYDVYKYDVFSQYLEMKAVEYNDGNFVINHKDSIYSLLDKISEYMINKKEFFKVPSTIFDIAEQGILAKMLSNEVIFKDEEIIKEGMLERKGVIISFTFDEFRDFCITEYILKNYSDINKFIKFWKDMNDENFTIREGVSKYSFYLARTMSQSELLSIIETLPEYEDMYWNFIWGLEDKYLSKEDMENWKVEVFKGGKYDKKIVHDLIMKYDCEYFRNINIMTLFDILDEIAMDSGKYMKFIKKMFDTYYKSNNCYSNEKHKSVLPFNYLLGNLEEYVDSDTWNINHYLCYKLTIYLMELKNWQTIELWKKLYDTSPRIVIRILSEMNNHSSSNLNGNVKEILLYLDKVGKNDKYDSQIKQLYDANTFCADININFDEIFNIILGE